MGDRLPRRRPARRAGQRRAAGFRAGRRGSHRGSGAAPARDPRRGAGRRSGRRRAPACLGARAASCRPAVPDAGAAACGGQSAGRRGHARRPESLGRLRRGRRRRRRCRAREGVTAARALAGVAAAVAADPGGGHPRRHHRCARTRRARAGGTRTRPRPPRGGRRPVPHRRRPRIGPPRHRKRGRPVPAGAARLLGALPEGAARRPRHARRRAAAGAGRAGRAARLRARVAPPLLLARPAVRLLPAQGGQRPCHRADAVLRGRRRAADGGGRLVSGPPGGPSRFRLPGNHRRPGAAGRQARLAPSALRAHGRPRVRRVAGAPLWPARGRLHELRRHLQGLAGGRRLLGEQRVRRRLVPPRRVPARRRPALAAPGVRGGAAHARHRHLQPLPRPGAGRRPGHAHGRSRRRLSAAVLPQQDGRLHDRPVTHVGAGAGAPFPAHRRPLRPRGAGAHGALDDRQPALVLARQRPRVRLAAHPPVRPGPARRRSPLPQRGGHHRRARPGRAEPRRRLAAGPHRQPRRPGAAAAARRGRIHGRGTAVGAAPLS